MNGALLIDFGAVLLTALLVFQSMRYKVFYVKPFVGVGMFIVFGVVLLSVVQVPEALGASEVPTLLYISSLGLLIGFGWAMEGLDRFSRRRRGEK